MDAPQEFLPGTEPEAKDLWRPGWRPFSNKQGRGGFGVIDVGSNSVRLVVFDRLCRTPLPLFNEKALCGLGRRMRESGDLDPEGMALTLRSLQRFATLAHSMGVNYLQVLATAAVREANNGPAFARDMARTGGLDVRVLSGGEEATYAAFGVLAGIPEAAGLVGDLGGGSLELVGVDGVRNGANTPPVSLPIGPLRLMAACDGDLKTARKIVDDRICAIDWLGGVRGRALYAVGGSWRGVARVKMGLDDYPLAVIQHYEMPIDQAYWVCQKIVGMSRKDLAQTPRAPRRRVDTLPYAAVILESILDFVQPDRVVFSAYGLREGFLFSHLPRHVRLADPLIAACKDMARREARGKPLGDRLTVLTDALFPHEEPWRARARRAACILADVGWRDHPDYRADSAYMRGLHGQFYGLDHAGRAFLALALRTRYGGDPEDAIAERARAILAKRDIDAARALGAAVRLTLSYCGGAPILLDGLSFRLSAGLVELMAPEGAQVLTDGTINRRLRALARAIGRDGAIRVA